MVWNRVNGVSAVFATCFQKYCEGGEATGAEEGRNMADCGRRCGDMGMYLFEAGGNDDEVASAWEEAGI